MVLDAEQDSQDGALSGIPEPPRVSRTSAEATLDTSFGATRFSSQRRRVRQDGGSTSSALKAIHRMARPQLRSASRRRRRSSASRWRRRSSSVSASKGGTGMGWQRSGSSATNVR